MSDIDGNPAPARAALLTRVVEYAASHGLADQSLREIALGVGTSHRMLHYHFGSREGLVAAVVAHVEEQQRSLLDALGKRHDDPRALVREQWQLLTRPETLAHVRLFYELAGAAVHRRPGTDEFRDAFLEPWLAAGRRAAADLDPVPDAALRLGVAVLRGLLLDVVITGDLPGATSALEYYLAAGSAEVGSG